MCELWRKRSCSNDIIGDIYDGQVWRDFNLFLSQKYSWCLALNVDWFSHFLMLPIQLVHYTCVFSIFHAVRGIKKRI